MQQWQMRNDKCHMENLRNRSRNLSFVHFILLPLLFLTVALLGGLRISVDHAFIFVAPPLITLVLAVLLILLFVRGRLVEFQRWLRADLPPLMNVSHAWMLVTLFFASAQAFNSVLPERGLLYWLFSFFFLWTLWNNQFSSFDAPRLMRSLVVLFGTAFALKHILLASLYSPEGGWLKKLAGVLLQGVSLGTLDAPAFAPATGYISFFTLALYVGGLLLLLFQGDAATAETIYSNQIAVREPALEEIAGRPNVEGAYDRESAEIPAAKD
jgi:hypothetical protein